MTLTQMSLDDLLGLDRYEIDDQSHISIDHSRCKLCALKPCLTVCPAAVYVWADEKVAIRYENCLECGTCMVACEGGGEGGIDWRPPRGGFGIVFRYG